MTDAPRSLGTGLPARTDGRIERPLLDRPMPETAIGTQARAARPAPAPRSRLPSLRELAALMVGGVLRLPPRYFRGMYLDITV